MSATPATSAARPAAATPPLRYRGEVVYLYAFDLAYEMTRRPVTSLLGQPVAEFTLDASKRAPRQLSFYRPWMVRLPEQERFGPYGALRVKRSVKLLPVGAISIAFRVPFEVAELGDLVTFHDLAFSHSTLREEVRALAEEIRREIAPHLVRPHEALGEDDAYTVFCCETPLPGPEGSSCPAEEWFLSRRREIAALLTQEAEPGQLSQAEVEESTARHLSYYEDDLVVVDWDAALLADSPHDFDETLYLMELANLQLAELQAYDRMLDDSLDHAYRDLRSRSLRSRAATLDDLRELRIDLARFSDELSNITKFFGDWHFARVYSALAARFHLADWHGSLDQKLKTLDELYAMLAQDRMNRLMLTLEVLIVLLFIVDLAVLIRH